MAHLFQRGGTYAAFRPDYPDHLYDTILAFARLPAKRLAIDVATGSGQARAAARALAARFDRVIGLDASEAQLAHAPRGTHNIEFRLADAHATGLPAGCADLITVAQALHWFDAPAFYREARRALRPAGALAAWCYGLPVVEAAGHPGDAAMRELYNGLLPWWDERRKLVEGMYEGLEPRRGVDFREVARELLEMRRTVTVDALVGYVSSWSAYTLFVKERGEAAGAARLSDFRSRILASLDAAGSGGISNEARPADGDAGAAADDCEKEAVEAGSGAANGLPTGDGGEGQRTLALVMPIALVLAREPLPLQE